MSTPTTRALFKEYCLRRLGKPVIEINVADEQVEDRIDDALLYWRDYHADATERQWLSYSVTAADKTNRYIDMSLVAPNVIFVTNILDVGDSVNTQSLFNIRYQIHLNDLYDFTSVSYVPYKMAMSHIEELEQLFVGFQPLRYQRLRNRLYIDMDWDTITEGQFIVIECYTYHDESEPNIWNDRWLKEYTTNLIKKQWGSNLIKYEGMQLPGGITFNGRQLFDDADGEIRRLESDMLSNYALPAADLIG